MSHDLKGRHVVITGGTGALGAGVVPRLLDEGAVCHVVSHRDDPPPSHERIHFYGERLLDDEDTAVALFEGLPEAPWASIHLVGGFTMAPLVDTSLETFQRMLNLNLVTAFLSCREAVRRMRSAGGGRIVNVVARPVLQPAARLSAYAASKAGVLALTQSLAEEVKTQDILVNAVAPSVIDTDANRHAMPDAAHDQWPSPVDLAETIAFLVSPNNRVTSGACIPVYGRA